MASDVLPKASFWVILALQWVCVPFFAVMLFFGWLGFDHYSPADKQGFLLAVAYIPALVVAGYVGVRLLRRRQYPAAIALALAPPLLIVLPTMAAIMGGG